MINLPELFLLESASSFVPHTHTHTHTHTCISPSLPSANENRPQSHAAGPLALRSTYGVPRSIPPLSRTGPRLVGLERGARFPHSADLFLGPLWLLLLAPYTRSSSSRTREAERARGLLLPRLPRSIMAEDDDATMTPFLFISCLCAFFSVSRAPSRQWIIAYIRTIHSEAIERERERA